MNQPPTPADWLTIEQRMTTARVDFFDGMIFETLIYNRALSQNEIAAVTSYIKNKWTTV